VPKSGQSEGEAHRDGVVAQYFDGLGVIDRQISDRFVVEPPSLLPGEAGGYLLDTLNTFSEKSFRADCVLTKAIRSTSEPRDFVRDVARVIPRTRFFRRFPIPLPHPQVSPAVSGSA
jgi:hypothetical protein